MTTSTSLPGRDESPVVWPVSALNHAVRQLLERAWPLVWVSGEISNLTQATSGHCYFALKDAQGQARCVMFRSRAALLPFRLREGLQVEARVTVSLYEPRGDFQLNVESLRLAGAGALFEAFTRLKSRLEQEGLFDPSRKRALPAMPRCIGLITSPQAAALRDVVTTLRRRAPQVSLILYPAPVQGEDAAPKLARALAVANARREVDLLILCRGGGSIEDLWAFNDEALARAIAASAIPVISGVGHETDFTIADFVADLRAPTPTAAAELAAPDQRQLQARLDACFERLRRATERSLERAAQRLDGLSRRLQHPAARLARQRAAIAQLGLRHTQAIQLFLSRKQHQLATAERRLWRQRPAPSSQQSRLRWLGARFEAALKAQLAAQQSALQTCAARLEALNPDAVLLRGYSRVEDARGRLIRDSATLRIGTPLRLYFARGTAEAQVTGLPDVQPSLGLDRH
jgi:exodeoxyribonuclease VII large subunit